MNTYRVLLKSKNEKYGVCCVLVSAQTEERAVELARIKVKDIPELLNAQYSISKFDTSKENVSIC